MRISVVIPNHNGARFLGPLLDDLHAQSVRAREVLVVDNGSTDESVELAKKSGARVIEEPVNRGFASAVNLGVRWANEEAVAVLNNDLRLAPEWLERTAHEMTGTRSFVVGKVLSMDRPDLIDGTYDLVCRGGTAWRAGSACTDSALWSQAREIQLAPFTAILLRREWFLGLGGLDERFESYLEDVDFGLRSASSGHTGYYCPDAVCRHAGSATWGRWSPATVKLLSRNQVFVVAKHYDGSSLRRLGWQIAVAQTLWGLIAARHGQLGAWLAGKAEGLRDFASMRNAVAGPGIEDVLRASEQQIRELQQACEWPDTYWRWYFRLTS